MNVIRLHAFGPAENLRYETAEDPEPAAGQVRIAVAAAGVHFVDTNIRSGEPGPFPPPDLPTIPGREVAGTVDRVGPGVDEKWLGTAVVAHLGAVPGGYAELAVTGVGQLHEIPAGLDPAAAVAMIGTGRTTFGILQFATLEPGTVAVVTAAAGGIGTLLVQHLKNAGLTVVGLAGGAAKTDLVAANGADLALDYRQPGWADRVRERFGERPAALLFDGVGGDTARAAIDLLTTGGTHLVFGWSSGDPVDLGDDYFRARGIESKNVLGPQMTERAGGIRVLETRALAKAASGRLRPALQPFPLAEAAAAHRALETRASTGKVVLIP
ncbi:NADPH:quinone reductase-like Zn-dependent oxidoreductase [Nocardia transvalensis]|uniref:NADPH:quinone reductase-like Zn-dependent oxidoreductase n=1 Tax=Nocardia transvalensis TaxID=37333 RepID=A0A7W9PKA1_9NOCA|nr:zinc-binding dehydrogenase [Nocardia transvalensis]MBB5917159.1 NADPH:quinone reductase-like Zn-dependent oxidoreductase [Nocardia transvalensis]